MTRLRLGLLQYGVTPIADFAAFEAKLDALIADGARGADLLVLPEYACMELAAASTGGVASAHDELRAIVSQADRILDAMRRLAMRHRAWLIPGSIPFRIGEAVRNRAPLIAPDGSVRFQDKRVMTRFEREEWGVEPGDPPTVFETPWGLVGIAICYDVEFPSLVRAQVEAGAWVILVPTCTDTMHGFARVHLSAQARALENQVYVAIAPTVGDAPHLATLDHNRGHAALFGPVDRGFPPDGVLARGALDMPQWMFATLERERLDHVREHGAVRNHRDWPDAVAPAAIAGRTEPRNAA